MLNGTTVANYPTGYTVLRDDLIGTIYNQTLQRMQVQSSQLPCIFNGLQVSINAGLVATVTAGVAQGDNIEFSESVDSPYLGTFFGLVSSQNVTCTDNSTGYIVLNAMITPDPLTVVSDSYDVATDNGSAVALPVYVTTLTPGPGTSYPYTQIVLAKITTASGAITDIDTSGANRSFDWSSFVTRANSGGWSTGDVKQSYGPQSPEFWIPMDDNTIGSSSSGATHASDTYSDLYVVLWNSVSNIYCPVTGGRGGSAAADFAANKPMLLPATVGRALCNSGTATLNMNFTAAAGVVITVPTTASMPTGTPVNLSNVGGALPAPLAAATTYYTVSLSGSTLSLATSRANVNNVGGAPVVITLTDGGSGTNTITVNYTGYAVGQNAGEQDHQTLVAETAAHEHIYFSTNGAGGTSTPNSGQYFGDLPTSPAGGDGAHNNIQPSTFIPVYIHL